MAYDLNLRCKYLSDYTASHSKRQKSSYKSWYKFCRYEFSNGETRIRTSAQKNDENTCSGVEGEKMLYVPEKAIEWGGNRDADKILKMRQGKSFRKLDLLSVATEELT
jgi:hypothetical protein